MGLCKCPRKKVTNLFCFEHRVNVCEHCLVDAHGDCVVQSYLAWLQDSDYDPNCSLCGLALGGEGDKARLLCLHLFHWPCLQRWAASFPPTTAPGGFRCPLCQDSLFPKPSQAGPVADALRTRLKGANWARAGLGLPLLPELMDAPEAPPPAVHPNPQGPQHHPNPEPTMVRKTTGNAGPAEWTSSAPLLGADKDADLAENKYKRRSAADWLRRFIKSRQRPGAADPFRGYKRILVILLLIFVGAVVVITILTRAAQSEDEGEDPFLDPLGNPNLRVAGVED